MTDLFTRDPIVVGSVIYMVGAEHPKNVFGVVPPVYEGVGRPWVCINVHGEQTWWHPLTSSRPKTFPVVEVPDEAWDGRRRKRQSFVGRVTTMRFHTLDEVARAMHNHDNQHLHGAGLRLRLRADWLREVGIAPPPRPT